MKLAKFTAIAALAATALPAPSFAADKYEFDKSHTRILFYVNHLGFSDMVGEFTDYDGAITFDEKKPEDSTLDITIKPSGIRTSSAKLDGELQGEKFFNSEKFPTIKFVSSKSKSTGANDGEVEGTLTMLGVSKPATLKVHFNKADYHPFTNNFVAGFSASAVIKRSEFGFTNLIPMVGDEVRLEVQTEIVNLDRKKQEEIKHK